MGKQLAIVKDKEGLNNLLTQMTPQITTMMPVHMQNKVGWMLQKVRNACAKDDKLFKCTGESLAKAIMTSVELGLDCSGGYKGQAFIIPYGNVATFIPGYKGLIDLARRSGEVSSIRAAVVYQSEVFHEVAGTADNAGLVHEPMLDGDRGAFRAAYAVAVLTNGEKVWAVMNKADIEAIRKASAGRNGPAWKDHYGQMAIKTVLRRLCKLLPISEDLFEKALEAEDRVTGINFDNLKQASVETNGDAAQALADKLTGKAEPEPEPDPPVPGSSEPSPEEQEIIKLRERIGAACNGDIVVMGEACEAEGVSFDDQFDTPTSSYIAGLKKVVARVENQE